MVEVAARRAAGEPRIAVRLSDGRGLDGIADGSMELVVAVDSFPYIVQAGAPLVARMLAEIDRVLAPGGHLALFNYSYGGDSRISRRRASSASLTASDPSRYGTAAPG